MDLKSMIVAEFSKTVTKAITTFAQSEKTTTDKIQLSLGLAGDYTPKFHLYKEYQPVRALTILEVLCVKIDFHGKGDMINAFLPKVLISIIEAKGLTVDRMRIMCILASGKVVLYIMDGSTNLGRANLEDYINEADFMP